MNDDVLDNSDSSVPPWPWKTWISDAVSALTSCGFRPWMTGLRPPSSRSRSSAGCGAVDRDLRPCRQQLRRPRAVDEFEVAVADEVEVAHRGLGAGGQHDVAVGVEVDQDRVVRSAATRRSTVPTRMPATRTESPAFSRDASANTAE